MSSLDRACVRISGRRHLSNSKDRSGGRLITPVRVAAGRLMKLFQGLTSARTLELHLDTFEILESIHESFEFQTSPFTRLKTLAINVECKEKSFDIPYSLSRYFFGNPSNKETNNATLSNGNHG
ncbi:unnamed protein product [Linum tenue]|uniref:Uncharacterized protein n=1 Tax=Linum tenue TaxID=586396 RepID=A0AAV0JTV8_9ROSI|nr:unnamed protein product [Linum tenue]